MDKKYWLNKWNAGEIGFHQEKPHAQLVKFFLPVGPQKVVVPLCGKSLDMLWLLSQGHEVVGVELSSVACESFFQETHLHYQKREWENFTIYESEGIAIWSGDFFELPDSFWSGCTYIYDRAAMIALPPDLREKYIKKMVEQVKKNPSLSDLILITVEYESPELIGPPFSVSESEVFQAYQGVFTVEKVNALFDHTLSGRPPKFNKIEVWEKTYRGKACR